MRVEIVKRADGAGVLRCTRDDGSVTWQKQNERFARHFSYHDLTHFAVETELGLKRGFFGLIAEGWEIEDTTGKGSRGDLPPDAAVAELIVGLFDGERRSDPPWTAEQINEFAPRKLTADEIERIKKRRSELFEKWAAVPEGGKLELQYSWQATKSDGLPH